MYDTFSSVYDKFVNWQNRLAYEMPFIEKQLQTLGKPKGVIRILDAACGTGMHVIELARRGYQAFGADLSTPMVQKAVENAAAFDVTAGFKSAGFGELRRAFVDANHGKRFDAVLVLGNSLPHILEQSTLDRTLEDIRASLTPNGFLLFQNRNFDAVVEKQQRWMEPQSYHGPDGEWIFIRFYDFEPDGKIRFNIVSLHRSDPSDWRQTVESTLLYPWQSDQMVSSLQMAGFSQITCFGDMEGHPYDPASSGNLVIRADVWSPNF